MANNDTRISQPTRYCTHGYERCVRGTDGILRHDAAADRYIAPARPILAYSRYTGEPLAIVPSSSEPGRVHVVTMAGTCSCKSYSYRNRCRHTGVAPRQPVSTPLVSRWMA